MKRHLLISAAVLALSAGSVMADGNVAEITQVGSTDIMAEQHQPGSDNMAFIDQDRATGDATTLNAEQTQNGTGDFADIFQADSIRNQATQTQSGGPGNMAQIDQSGGTSSDNDADQQQVGEDNDADITQRINSNDNVADQMQFGNDNDATINQISNSSLNRAFQVQNGNDNIALIDQQNTATSNFASQTQNSNANDATITQNGATNASAVQTQ